MRIERVDDKTVKCFLSNEELEEYQIDYKDFILRSEKAKQVVQDIIMQAEEQVGYKPPKFAFDMQIMLLPDQGLLLTFSESDPINGIPGAQQLMEYLREMKQALERTKQEMGLTATGDGRALPQEVGKPAKSQKKEKPGKAIFVFENIGQVMSYAAALPGNLRVHSALYEMDGVYYLFLQKGSAAYERFSRACIQAMEFGRLFSTDETMLLQMREHGGCLIEEKALQKLRG
ncbi:MAG: adaptor protein MecA [Lachnospiraceae bacterium]|nr:adaptor protein MecA [Lachnospiraceae bacterium]